MSPIKNKISQLFKSKKLNVFVLFFVISLTILILSKLSQNYQGTLVFKVKPTNAKETQVILNDTSNQLKITLDTYGFKWLRYAINKPTVEVDLESDVILKDSTLNPFMEWPDKHKYLSNDDLILRDKFIFFRIDCLSCNAFAYKYISTIYNRFID